MHIVGIGTRCRLARYIFHVRGKRAGNFDEGDKRRGIAIYYDKIASSEEGFIEF